MIKGACSYSAPKAVLFAAAFAATPTYAQTSTLGANANTVVVRPLSFVKDDDLEFGSIIRGTTAGTVVMAPNNVRTATGGVTLAPSVNRPSRFAGFGSSGQQVQISMAANSITINRAGGGGSMTVDTFMIGSSPTWQNITTAPRTFTIGSATGVFNFALGATLRIGANQAPGLYSGTFTVILNYQ
jgi:Domain of unknown function (DUF4402)